MRRLAVLAGAAAGTAGVIGLGLRLRGGRAHAQGPEERWRAVTIDCSSADVSAPGSMPPALADLDFEVEFDVRPAPGGRGVEVRARPAQQQSESSTTARLRGTDPVSRLRVALRSVKQSIEAGEVLRVDPAPHGSRPSTPTGLLLDLIAKRSQTGGPT